jgi:pantoate--beta-alanine ligase
MAADLAIQTRVVPCPTVREQDGLALSSRNARLTAEQRAAAPVIRRALLEARHRWVDGERSAENLRRAMRSVLDGEPLATVEYVSVADASALDELETIDRPALLSMAVSFGEVRLIDNEVLE